MGCPCRARKRSLARIEGTAKTQRTRRGAAFFEARQASALPYSLSPSFLLPVCGHSTTSSCSFATFAPSWFRNSTRVGRPLASHFPAPTPAFFSVPAMIRPASVVSRRASLQIFPFQATNRRASVTLARAQAAIRRASTAFRLASVTIFSCLGGDRSCLGRDRSCLGSDRSCLDGISSCLDGDPRCLDGAGSCAPTPPSPSRPPSATRRTGSPPPGSSDRAGSPPPPW